LRNKDSIEILFKEYFNISDFLTFIKEGGKMNIRIQSVNFDATEMLQTYINKKMAKLEKFHDEIVNAEIFLKVIKPETANNKEAEIKLSLRGQEFFAAKTCDTFEEAVDLAVEAIDKQLKKHKERLTKK
jgi:putative sigma-54 modulation protein